MIKFTKEFIEETIKFFKQSEKYFYTCAIYIVTMTVFLFFIGSFIFCFLEFIDQKICPLPMFKFKPYEGYIYAFPDSNRAKNYRLKFKKTEYGFYLFFPNGGSKYFENCEDFNLEGNRFSCFTENDTRDWEFRCYNIDIKE